MSVDNVMYTEEYASKVAEEWFSISSVPLVPFSCLSNGLKKKFFSDSVIEDFNKLKGVDRFVGESFMDEIKLNAAPCPPSNNMGGIKYTRGKPDGVCRELGKLVKNPDNEVNTDAAFIDHLSFSFKVSSFYDAFPDSSSLSMESLDVVSSISSQLVKILGFGVTRNRFKGMNSYRYSFDLGDGWGHLCIGGKSQNSTCLIIVHGQGCMASSLGSGRLVYDFMRKIHAKITRVDVSADYFEGEYNLDMAVHDYMEGNFYIKGKEPKINQAGNWLKPDGSGRTLYVGSKKSGKELCIYEKGKHLGGDYAKSFNDWVRVELRLFSKDRIVPLDIIINSGKYLAGGYPALSFVSAVQCRIKTSKNKIKIEYERAIEVVKKQFGKFIYAIAGNEGSVSKIIIEEIPKRIVMPSCNGLSKELVEMDFLITEEFALKTAFLKGDSAGDCGGDDTGDYVNLGNGACV